MLPLLPANTKESESVQGTPSAPDTKQMGLKSLVQIVCFCHTEIPLNMLPPTPQNCFPYSSLAGLKMKLLLCNPGLVVA